MPTATDIRLLAIDMDGTLIEHGGRALSAANAEALHLAARAGVEVVPISGRAPFGLEYPLHNFPELSLMIAYNGALIYDRQTKTDLFDQRIEPAAAQQALQLLLDHHLYLSCYLGTNFYVREDSPEAQFEGRASGQMPVIEPDLFALCQRGVHKLLALERDDPERLRRFYDQAVRELPLISTVYTSPMSVELNHHAVSKGTAVRWLAQKRGYSRSQVMAVGDNFNDLSMFAEAGLSVALGDAPAEVQAQADWLAPPVSQDGAAAAIWRFILDRPAGES
jgi:Cof subfamily protein (haloacid dehalogenase superfamily)